MASCATAVVTPGSKPAGFVPNETKRRGSPWPAERPALPHRRLPFGHQKTRHEPEDAARGAGRPRRGGLAATLALPRSSNDELTCSLALLLFASFQYWPRGRARPRTLPVLAPRFPVSRREYGERYTASRKKDEPRAKSSRRKTEDVGDLGARRRAKGREREKFGR